MDSSPDRVKPKTIQVLLLLLCYARNTMEKRAKTGAWTLNQDNVSECSFMSTSGLLLRLNNIYFMTFEYTIIQIYILKQCTMGFRNKLSNLCKSVPLIWCFSELAL